MMSKMSVLNIPKIRIVKSLQILSVRNVKTVI